MPARLHLIKVWRGYSKVKMTCLTTHRTNVRTCGWPPLESTRWQDTRLAGPYASRPSSRPDGGISWLSRASLSRRWVCQSQVQVGGQGASALRTLHPAAGNVAMLHLPLLVTAPVPILTLAFATPAPRLQLSSPASRPLPGHLVNHTMTSCCMTMASQDDVMVVIFRDSNQSNQRPGPRSRTGS